MAHIKLFTLNVWSGFRYHGLIRLEEYETKQVREKRFQGLCAVLRKERPDIVCLNEANPLFSYGKRLAEELGYVPLGHMGVAGLRAGKLGFPLNLREGDLVLASPSLSPQYIGRTHLGGKGYCGNFFSCHFDNLTQAVLVRCMLPEGRPLYVCVTHWVAGPAVTDENRAKLPALAQEWGFPKEQIAQAEVRLWEMERCKRTEATRLCNWLEQTVPPDAPLIVAGDFNAEAGWPELEILRGRGFERLIPREDGYATWDPLHNTNLQTYYTEEAQQRQKSLYHQLDALDELYPRNIDHFYVRNLPLEGAADCRVCATEPYEGVSISDHFALTVSVEARAHSSYRSSPNRLQG